MHPSKNKAYIILPILILFFAILAWHHRFVADDAFITFRYAQNFANGNGLTWNVGEPPVEGYTNFLWTILISIGFYLNLDPIVYSQLLGIFFFCLTLFYTYKLAYLILESENYALLAVVLTGINFSFNTFATSGLETSSQAFYTVFCFYLAVYISRSNHWSISNLILLSLGLSAALLTRLDGGLLVVIISAFLLYEAITRKLFDFKKFFALALPITIIVGTWFTWKYFFYGNILPNSFYLKVDPITFFKLVRGSAYVLDFLVIYGFFICLPALLPSNFRALLKNGDRYIILVLAFILAWIAYVVRLGGDFFEFRFIINIVPLLYILTIFIIKTIYTTFAPYAYALMIGMSLSYTFFPSFYNKYFIYKGFGNFENISQYTEEWIQMGKILHRDFYSDEGQNPKLAISAAGAMPFYSQLPSFDILGLNSPEVLVSGFKRKDCLVCTGHNTVSYIQDLLDSHVNLVVGFPTLVNNFEATPEFAEENLKRIFFHLPLDFNKVPQEAKIISIPFNETKSWVILYLIPNETVEKGIRQNNLQTFDLGEVK